MVIHRKSPASKKSIQKSSKKSTDKNMKKSVKQSAKKSTKKSAKKNAKKSYSNISKTSGRGSATKGWKKIEPHKGKERKHLMDACGPKCFLDPIHKGFPICDKCIGSKCSCKIDCKAVIAAKTRSSQYGYKHIHTAATKLKC